MPIAGSDSRAYAGFFSRMFAFFVDALLFFLVSGAIRFPFWLYTIGGGTSALTAPLIFSFSAWDIIVYLTSVAYFVLFTYCTGTTIGKRLLGLRVVSADGGHLSFWNVLYRETIGRYLSSVLMLGYLMIGISSEKKALHDLLCDTRVIYWMRPEPRYEKPIAPTKREENFVPYVPPFGVAASGVPPAPTYGSSSASGTNAAGNPPAPTYGTSTAYGANTAGAANEPPELPASPSNPIE